MDLTFKNQLTPHSNSSSEKSCIHSRQLVALIDADKNDQRMKFFKEHAKKCHVCQSTLQNLEKGLVRLDFYIPRPKPNLESTNEFSNEVSVMLENIGVTRNAVKKQKRIKLLSTVAEINKDLGLIFNSKSFVLGTFFVLALYLAQRMIN